MQRVIHSPGKRRWFFMFALLVLVAVSGCGTDYAGLVEENIQPLQERMQSLATRLDQKTLSNARIIKNYAGRLASSREDLAELAKALEQDATTSGTPYQSLITRLGHVDRSPRDEGAYQVAVGELNNLWAASDPVVFNDSLLDIVNTLADLSEGDLPRINLPVGKSSAHTGVEGSQVAGSYLVGNPSYGQWRSDSSGGSFWEWYGKYAMFSSVISAFGGGYYHRGPLFARSWYGAPRYSYYHDVGRGSYGSFRDRQTWNKSRDSLASKGVRTAKPRSFGSVDGRRRVSTYASRRGSTSSAQGLARASRRSSSFSAFRSSARGTSAGSRGLRGGK